MMSGAVYGDVGAVPWSGGNSWIHGLTAPLELVLLVTDVDDDTAGFSRSQFAAITIKACIKQ